MSKSTRKTLMLLVFVLPALAFYTAFVLIPALGGFWYSLTDWNGLNPSYRIVGLANYVEALTGDLYFLKSLKFTLRFVVYMVFLQNAIALFLAVLVEGRKRGRIALRTVFFMPNMVSMIIGGFMWMFVFSRVLPFLAELPALRFLDQSWIGDPRFSFWAIVIVSLWGGVGYLMVIYVAALQGVPANLKEAAYIDGANAWHAFRHVTLPMIFPSLTVGVFVTLNSSFKVFDVVYSLTGGGPGRATQVVALNIFEEAFKRNNRYGYASAKATILFAIICGITLIQLWLMKRREVEM
jgi:raffinose/stachyose/melibiose transport system permease protein